MTKTPLTKMMCQHSLGFDYETREMFGWVEEDGDPSKIYFNHCPWCGDHVSNILERLKDIPNQDDCIKGGCND